MSDFKNIDICSVNEFLAHVIALKSESEERLHTMADCLHAHNNPLAAEIFRELAELIATTVEQVESQAAGFELPEIPPWEYQWHCSNNPDALCMDHAHYLMNARQALELALYNEQRSLAFYQQVEEICDDDAVRAMAVQQIRVEQDFAQLVRSRLNALGDDDAPCDDLDPPHMPE